MYDESDVSAFVGSIRQQVADDVLVRAGDVATAFDHSASAVATHWHALIMWMEACSCSGGVEGSARTRRRR